MVGPFPDLHHQTSANQKSKHWAEPKFGLTEASGMAADRHPWPGTLEPTTPLQAAVSLLLGGSWFEVGAGSGYRK